MPDRAVIWDIDGTLLDSSLERHLIAYLLKNHHTTKSRFLRNILALVLKGKLSERGLKYYYLKGMTEQAVNDHITASLSISILPALRNGARELIEKFKRDGFLQMAVSGTLAPLGRQFSDHLLLDHLIATPPEIIGGVYTGSALENRPYADSKRIKALEWLNQKKISPQDAVALGNSYADRYLLGAVGKAICVTPDSRLEAHARKCGWIVVDDLKQVFELQ